MKKYLNSVVAKFDTTQSGNAATGTTITVRVNGAGTKAAIYSDNGVTQKENPFTVDNNGNYEFYVADGQYNIVQDEGKPTELTLSDVAIYDLSVTLGSPSTTTALINSKASFGLNNVISVNGYDNVFDGGAVSWIKTGDTGTPSQTPAQRGDGTITDAIGGVWAIRDSQVSLAAFGAPTNGDATDAIQAAFNWMADSPGKKLIGGPNTYNIAGIDHEGHANVDFTGTTFIGTANTTMIKCGTPLSGPYAITSDYAAGDLNISVESVGDVFVEGQRFKIMSDARDPANRDNGSGSEQYRIGEFSLAGEGSTDTNIVLSKPLRFTRAIDRDSSGGNEAEVDSYTVVNAARIVVPDDSKIFNWVGGEFYFQDGNDASWNATALRLVGYKNPKVIGARVMFGYGPAIQLSGTYNAFLLNTHSQNLTDNTANGQRGYGISDAGWNTLSVGHTSHNVRHAYTSSVNSEQVGESNPLALISVGRVVGARIIGGHATGGESSMWDTHHESEDVVFDNCVAESGGFTGFSARGRNIKFNSPSVRNCQNGIIVQTEYDSGDPNDDFFVNGRNINDFTSAEIINADIECVDTPFINRHANVNISGLLRVRAGTSNMILNSGSRVKLSASGTMQTSNLGGSIDYVDASGVGAFELLNPNTNGVPPMATRLIVTKGCDIDVDATSTVSTGIFGIKAESDSAAFINGNLDFSLRGNTPLLSPTGIFSGDKYGNLDFSLLSGTASSTVHNLSGRNVRAASSDGTVIWDATKRQGNLVMKPLYYNGNVGIAHAGTGAEVNDVFIPNGQDGTVMMNDNGEGRLVFKVSGRKSGANGAAIIRIRAGGTIFVAQIDLAASDNSFDAAIDFDVLATDSQRYTLDYRASSGGAASVSQFVSNETVAFGSSGFAVRFSVEAAVGDTINFDTIEVNGTTGGTL